MGREIFYKLEVDQEMEDGGESYKKRIKLCYIHIPAPHREDNHVMKTRTIKKN